MSPLAPLPFRPQRRGNRLETWTVTYEGGGHFLWLRCAPETHDQIRRVASAYRDAQVPAGATAQWTHVLYSPQAHLDPDVEQLLNLLEQVITLPVHDGMTGTIALDWYKIPPDSEHNYWRNTPTAELIHRGKYWYKTSAQEQAVVGRQLAELACDAVMRHAQLRQCPVVLDVPGHDATQLSFGSRLAATVARDTGKRFVKVRARDEFRAEAKAMDPADRVALLRGQFAVNESLAGSSVLIVDDVIRSGLSVSEVARAARSAGAGSVYGLIGARTMRN